LLISSLVASCGQMRPVPPQWSAQEYTPIEFEALQAGTTPPLAANQLVQCRAYFWQFLNYDPAPFCYYANQLRYPLSWGSLEWCAVYKTQQMQGYFDKVVMDGSQQREFDLKRLDPIILYGEVVPLGGKQVYLRVHHIAKDAID